MSKNANRPHKEDRIQKVLDLVSMGYMTYQIVNICKKEWFVSERTVKRYLTYVYTFLHKSLTEKDKDKIILEYEALINRFEKKGDSKMALQYRIQRDKVLGLNKIDITSGGEKLPASIINIINPRNEND